MKTTILAFAIFVASTVAASAATMAFCGEITKVEPDKNAHNRFSVKIDYYDYCSRGGFGKESVVGAEAQQRILKLGTVCVLNGELMNAESFAAAMKPGQWGYFYEDTWENVFTTPNFVWGEVIDHDPAKETIKLRIHRTHKQHHLPKNPPVEKILSYAGADIRIEEKEATADEAFKAGHWVQIHPERGGTVDLRTGKSEWSKSEWLPQAEGKRGYANDLSGPVQLKAVRADDPDKVSDNRIQIDVWRDGRLETIDCKSTTFVLDGKLCPATIAARPDRQAVLCYYRRDTAPHKIFVSSRGDGFRSEIPGGDMHPAAHGCENWLLDGQRSTKEVVSNGTGRVTVFPKRGKTFIAFRPHEVPAPTKKK